MKILGNDDYSRFHLPEGVRYIDKSLVDPLLAVPPSFGLITEVKIESAGAEHQEIFIR